MCSQLRRHQCRDQYVETSTCHFSELGILRAFVPLVANEQGSFTTPSFVSFTDQERLIGEAAKNQAAMNPTNTIFDIKSVVSSNFTP